MVGPGDQQIFEGRTESIPFSGFTVHPGQKIELFAKHPSTQNWVKIGETESTKDPYDYFDTKWYYWKKEVVVPKEFWLQWGKDGGFSTILKGTADKNDLFTFKEGFYNYFEDYASLEELYFENKSQTGVEILVWAKE